MLQRNKVVKHKLIFVKSRKVNLKLHFVFFAVKNLAYEPLKRDNTFVFGIEENVNPLKLSNSDPGSYLSLKPNIKRDATSKDYKTFL